MEPAGVVATIICAVAVVALAPAVIRAWRRRQLYGGLSALSLLIAALALLVAWGAQLSGAGSLDTGRFMIGMSAGLAIGLTIGSGLLLLASRRSSPPPLLPGEGAGV